MFAFSSTAPSVKPPRATVMRRLISLATAMSVAMALAAFPAAGAPIYWQLHDTVFADGVRALGAFRVRDDGRAFNYSIRLLDSSNHVVVWIPRGYELAYDVPTATLRYEGPPLSSPPVLDDIVQFDFAEALIPRRAAGTVVPIVPVALGGESFYAHGDNVTDRIVALTSGYATAFVPEPDALTLVSAGLFGLLFMRARRRAGKCASRRWPFPRPQRAATACPAQLSGTSRHALALGGDGQHAFASTRGPESCCATSAGAQLCDPFFSGDEYAMHASIDRPIPASQRSRWLRCRLLGPLLALAIALTPRLALAGPIYWQLGHVGFADGASAYGSFTVDDMGRAFNYSIRLVDASGDLLFAIPRGEALGYDVSTATLFYERVLVAGPPVHKDIVQLDFYEPLIPRRPVGTMVAIVPPILDGHSYYGHDHIAGTPLIDLVSGEAVAFVPEPGTVGLLAAGLISMLWARRRYAAMDRAPPRR